VAHRLGSTALTPLLRACEAHDHPRVTPWRQGRPAPRQRPREHVQLGCQRAERRRRRPAPKRAVERRQATWTSSRWWVPSRSVGNGSGRSLSAGAKW